MKRLLIVTAIGMLLASTAGCRFWNCLWRGPAYQQQCQPATVACPSTCVPSCNPCDSGAAVSTVTPGPVPFTATGAAQ
jgi:hypothetical protein